MPTRSYAAFLRGVSPMNARMADLKRCFEAAGFADVRTVASSGNVVFAARAADETRLERAAERAMAERLGRAFLTIVRPIDALRALLDAEPHAAFTLDPGSKRIVTFLRAAPRARPSLPLERDGARILCARGREIFSAYVPRPRGPAFMALIERSFGQELTTRTWEAVARVAAAAPAIAAPRRAR